MKTNVFKVFAFNFFWLMALRMMFSARFFGAGIHTVAANHPVIYGFLLAAFLAAAFIGNYILLRRKRSGKVLPDEQKCTPKNYIKTLHSYYYKSELGKQLAGAVSQIERLSAKEKGLLMILTEYFDKKELTYLKYHESIDEVCDMFYQNAREFTNTVSLFDEKEYRALRTNRLQLAPVFYQTKVRYYDEQFRRMNNLLYKNEEIITTLDNLLLSLTALSNSPRSENEKKQILEDMHRLTVHTKQYT